MSMRSFAPSGHLPLQVSLDSGTTSVLVDGPAAAVPPASGDSVRPANRSGIATSPKNSDVFLTAAHDGFLRKWSVDGRRLLDKLAVGVPEGESSAVPPGIGAVDWASGGSFVACGLSTGDVVLVSPSDMTVISRWVIGSRGVN